MSPTFGPDPRRAEISDGAGGSSLPTGWAGVWC